MRVLVAPDSFRGSLSAAEVATAVGAGLASAGLSAVLLPLADGGEGSVTAALHAGFTARSVSVRDALGRRHEARYAVRDGTAVVEVAQTCGLSTLPVGTLAPMTAASHGLGDAVVAAVAAGARRVVLCLGGSASTDGGSGMLAALGMRFLDDARRPVEPSGATLTAVTDLDVSGLLDLTGVELVAATDVVNPLLGASGAATIFGPQKGANSTQVAALEAGLTRLARVLARHPVCASDLDLADLDLAGGVGSGAAGGLGMACRWLGARRVSGAEFFLDLLGFDTAAAGCSAVVTGEGRLDSQTAGGKLPAVVATRAQGRPVHAVVGQCLLDEEQLRNLGLVGVVALRDLTELDPTMDVELSRRLAIKAGEMVGRRILSAGPTG